MSVFLIVANEFCERFSYYGMKTVLSLYLRDALGYSEDKASITYHLFGVLCYFTPIFGAILADAYAGKFMTILCLSILYAIGEVILAVSAIPGTLPQEAFSLVGLFIIAVGTGGIKPCVSAFGGDQFVRPQQDRQLEGFFSIFYISINAGALISTFITPILRRDVTCFDQASCFSLAFGVPAVLMIIAVMIFICGKPLYKMKKPEGNIMLDVAKCITHAIKRKWNSRKSKPKSHWLDYASDKYRKQLIHDIKRVLGVLVILIPVPVFWALFEQKGSRWTFQASRMNGAIGESSFSIRADQMQIVNPVLILLLVPFFESVVYPFFAKYNLLTPLQRMASGGILAGVAFVISGIIELQLEPTYPRIPDLGRSQLDFYNTLPCPIKIHAMPILRDITIEPMARFKLEEYPDFIEAKDYDIAAEIQLTDGKCGDLNVTQTKWNGPISAESHHAYSVLITLRDTTLFLKRMSEPVPLKKSFQGRSRVGFIFNLGDGSVEGTTITMLQDSQIKYTFTVNVSEIVQTQVQEMETGTYQFKIAQSGQPETAIEVSDSIDFKAGGCYVVVLQHSLDESGEKHNAWNFQVTPENSIHMLWLVPQYFIMTIAEVLISVTGLQFCFTQAPTSMRSVLQAVWLLTVAFGNLIVITVAKLKAFDKQSSEFFLFAGLMATDMLLFILLAYRYKSVDPNATSKEIDLDKAIECENSIPFGEPLLIDGQSTNGSTL